MIAGNAIFVGRTNELNELRRHMTGANPTSVNVYGEHRIGKSSLLNRFVSTHANTPDTHWKYLVSYVSLGSAGCQQPDGFYAHLAAEVCKNPAISAEATLIQALEKTPMDVLAFESALQECTAQRFMAVFCLDEFDTALRDQNRFPDAFYDHLRSWMNRHLLMFVLATTKELSVVANERQLTSEFFNLGARLHLQEFNGIEAQKLVQLEVNNAAVLNPVWQQAARRWAREHPFRLQIACLVALEAQQAGHSEQVAYQHFEERVATAKPRSLEAGFKWWLPFHWLFVRLPMMIGMLGKRIGSKADEMTAWFFGMGTLIVLILVMANWRPLKPFLENVLKGFGYPGSKP